MIKKNEGRYANYFKIGHNAFEFIFDFCQKYPGKCETKLNTRIITNPNYAKAFLHTLSESIMQYEKTFGIIKEE